MLNKAQLIGRLGRDPELRYMPNGDAVANFSIATSEKWRNKEGEAQEKTEWHRITAFRQLAEIIGKWLHKGSLVYIEGKITTRKWSDKDGVEKYTTEIVANEMKMLGSKDDHQGTQDAQEATHRPAGTTTAPKPAAAPQSRSGSMDTITGMDDDIPF